VKLRQSWAYVVWLVLLALLLGGCAGGAGRAGSSDIATESDISPEQKRALLRLELASAYFGNGQNLVALDEVKQAIAINSNSADAFSLRGLIYTRMGEMDFAEDSFKRALVLKPNAAPIQHNYGVFLCQHGRLPEAEKMFANALASPGYADRVKTWTTQGLCQRKAGALAEGRTSLLRAYELDPSNPTVGYNLALSMAESGEWTRAQFYLARIHASGARTSESLWLAIKAEQRLGNASALAQLGTQLRTQFPKSAQAQWYERKTFDE
jgi:type IV pilus assembly protein PilF